MNTISILVIALGLAMDAFAVSVTSGITVKQLRIPHALAIALSFGLFQAIMPIIGWFAGIGFKTIISGIDHWIAFGLLLFVGTKMIYEATKLQPSNKQQISLDIFVLLILSIATSIDALAVGLSFSFLQIQIMTPAIIIGIVTFLLSLIGIVVGKNLGHFFEKKIEILGGIILIAIGFKILISHLK